MSKVLFPVSVTAAAREKKCSRVAIYNHLSRFDVAPDGRIVPNKKYRDWSPSMTGGRVITSRKAKKGKK